MKKSDLKTGMIVEFDSGKIGMVLLGTNNGDIISGQTSINLDDLTNELESIDGFYYDLKIVKIHQPFSNSDYLSYGLIRDHYIAWECKKPKQMTLSEVEEALGYSIEIVKDKD